MNFEAVYALGKELVDSILLGRRRAIGGMVWRDRA